MRSNPVTYGDIADLLTGMGFQRKVLDENSVGYYDKPSDCLFLLHNRPAGTPAREGDIDHIRRHLHWRGLMDEADFDAHFASLTAAKS